MQVVGNIEGIKKSIERKYSEEIKALEKESREELKKIKAEIDKKIALMKADNKTAIEVACREAHSRIMNEEKLKAKKDFEEAREAMIEKVFQQVEKQLPKLAQDKQYLAFVKKKMPPGKGLQVVVGATALKRRFAKAKVDKEIVGVKFIAQNLIYDFSLNGMLESKKDSLRSVITKTLWGE